MSGFPVTDGVTTFLPPPKGYVVDFKHPQQQHEIDHYLIFGFLGVLAFLCLAQRLYTKHFFAGGLKIDDYLIFLAWLCSILLQAIQTWSIALGGLCHHAWEMPIQVFEKHMISSYIAAPLLILASGFSKASLLTFYLRISMQKWFRIAIWTSLSVVVTFTSIVAGLLLFGCRPIHAMWDPYAMATGDCVNAAALYIAIAIFNIISDVVLFIIPIPTVVGLKMPIAQKLGAAFMFGVGSVTVATSIIRMAYLPGLLSSLDIPWVAAPANVWIFTEVDLFIICGSMPTFRRFFKRFAPKLLGSWSAGNRNSPSQGRTYELSAASRFNRQQRTGYSQFGDLERGDTPQNEEDRKDAKKIQVTTSSLEGEVLSSTVQAAGRDDASEEAILGTSTGKGITYTKTFQVHYSE